jgi:hypothetical protein
MVLSGGSATGRTTSVEERPSQGLSSSQSMNKFKRVNLKYLREHTEALLESGQGLDGFYQ